MRRQNRPCANGWSNSPARSGGADPPRLVPGRSHSSIGRRAGRDQLRPSRRVRLGPAQSITLAGWWPARQCMSPTYDFAVHNRSDVVRELRPAPVIVVEGILVLHDPTLRERFDLKVYIDSDADVRFIRRLTTRCRRTRPHDRQHHRPIPRDGAAGTRAVHRAQQAVRRRDLSPRRTQRAGGRASAGPGTRVDRRRLTLR